jgi:hypothetical protein
MVHCCICNKLHTPLAVLLHASSLCQYGSQPSLLLLLLLVIPLCRCNPV